MFFRLGCVILLCQKLISHITWLSPYLERSQPQVLHLAPPAMPARTLLNHRHLLLGVISPCLIQKKKGEPYRNHNTLLLFIASKGRGGLQQEAQAGKGLEFPDHPSSSQLATFLLSWHQQPSWRSTISCCQVALPANLLPARPCGTWQTCSCFYRKEKSSALEKNEPLCLVEDAGSGCSEASLPAAASSSCLPATLHHTPPACSKLLSALATTEHTQLGWCPPSTSAGPLVYPLQGEAVGKLNDKAFEALVPKRDAEGWTCSAGTE